MTYTLFMQYQNHSCEHTDHEYVGSIKHAIVYDSNIRLPVDIFFLDETGGHDPHYHGCCVRFSDEPSHYASYAEMHMVEGKPVLWALYLRWCEKKGYQPQTFEWITENRSIPLNKRNCYVEDHESYGV